MVQLITDVGLNAFLDMRLPISLDGAVTVKLNGKDFPAFPLTPLQQGDASRINLPHDLTPLLREAVQLELQVPGHSVSFILLNWQKIRGRLESSCE